jgi:hypothetical protein
LFSNRQKTSQVIQAMNINVLSRVHKCQPDFQWFWCSPVSFWVFRTFY